MRQKDQDQVLIVNFCNSLKMKEVLNKLTYKVIEYNSSKGLEFEFVGIEGWEEFEKLVEIIEKKIFCKVVEKYDGPYSRFCLFEKEKLKFRLIQHPEVGNSLLAITQNDENNEIVRNLAHEVLKYYND